MRMTLTLALPLVLTAALGTVVQAEAQQKPKVQGSVENSAQDKKDETKSSGATAQRQSTQSQAAAAVLATDAVAEMIKMGVPATTVLRLVRSSPCRFDVSPKAVKKLKDNAVPDEIVEAMASCQPDLYLGWSVLPAKVVRDNYGHYVSKKYFAVDVAVYNRTENQLIVKAFEFHCRIQRDAQQQGQPTEDKALSTDPTLVRGSLEKGQIAGIRHILVGALQLVAYGGPSGAPFFKNINRKSNYQTGIALANALLKGFDENIFPDTILTYLRNWDKDEVLKRGFVIPGGDSTRGRIFLPIEVVYPRPDPRYKDAVKGKYDPTVVKQSLNSLSVLAQEVKLQANRTVTAGAQ